MKYADRLPITVARLRAPDSARALPIPGSTRIAIKPRFHPRNRRTLVDDTSGRHGCGVAIDLATAQHGPGDARHLVGERHGDEADRLAGQQAGDPIEAAGNVLALVADEAGGPADPQSPEIAVARPGDAAAQRLSAGPGPAR